MFDQPLQHYLSRVLGYQYLPRFNLSAVREPMTDETLGQTAGHPLLHLVTNEPKSQERDELISKMMKAIQCSDYLVVHPLNDFELLPKAPLVFLFGENQLTEPQKLELAQKVRLFESLSLSLIVSRPETAEVTKVKRQIWQDLQKTQYFLEQLKGSLQTNDTNPSRQNENL